MVSDEQVELLRRKRMEGRLTEEAGAAAAGMSLPTARKWREGPLPSESKKPRWWRTREDPFEEVWQRDVVPLLAADLKGELTAKTVLEELKEKAEGGEVNDRQLRTLQRRMRDWRAVQGPDREVVFPQEHEPGEQGAFDFTHCTELGVFGGGLGVIHLGRRDGPTRAGTWTWVAAGS